MKERWASFCLGAWLAGSLLMFAIAPTNFRLVDELLGGSENAAFRALVGELGSGSARELLRYLSSELNRSFFLRWNIVQTLLGGALIAATWRQNDRTLRWLALSATLLVVVLLVVFTPLITSLGRSLDFVPRQPPPPALSRFQLLHVGYTSLELVKVVLLAYAAFRLGRTSSALQRERTAAAIRSRI
jgi:cell division protein FtsW (lipid II flippase)